MASLSLGAIFAPAAHGQLSQPDVEIEFDQFGLGGQYRPGDIVPMRLVLTSSPSGDLEDVTPAWVQWEVPNADGDIGEYGRPITLQRGQRIPVWLYAPVPPNAMADTIWPVRVFEYRDGQRRHEIGGRRLQPLDFQSQNMPLNASMIGVVGQGTMGLHQYEVQRDERARASNDLTHILQRLMPNQLPDRWYGLKAFEAIAWSTALPQELTTDTAAAIREYVRRGGHLIVVLPEDANPWQFGGQAQSPLDDILPQQEPRRDAAVPVSETLSILSKSRFLPPDVPDFALGVRVFKELRVENGFDAITAPYEPLLALPDGRVIAIQRTFGHGRITVIGLDVSQRRLASIGLPHADVFWNRILGRRMDTPSGFEIQALADERMLITARGNSTDIGTGGLILDRISMHTAAGMGLILALLLFGAYWVLAGPGGFALLKMYKRTHHAWLAFAAAAALFTAVAWGAVGMIRVNEPRIEHITFLDHIARPGDAAREGDPQWQRAVSWFSLYTPGYNDALVSVESDRARRNLLLPWTPPPPHGVSPFPNANRYQVNVAESTHSYRIPSRQTSTLLHANWLGGLDSKWGGMIRQSIDEPIRVLLDGAGREMRLGGQLSHNFDGALRDVTVIWIRNLRLPDRRYQLSDEKEQPWVPFLQSGEMSNSGFAWRVPQWDAGATLDLADRSFEPLGSAGLRRTIIDRYVETHRGTRGPPTAAPLTGQQQRDHFEMLSIFHQLAPPQYFQVGADTREPVQFLRGLAREVDLSAWFNRPCLIVIGFLENSELPIPVQVGDDEPVSNGTTIVRWVYPLPLIEDLAFQNAADAEEPEDPAP